uniref:Uncharacterized protein n=1 Tax=Fibrocapsa japonica TaxID=94617 RepID=A0A7S2US98_9STRA|mmetsp:Transcript_10763/g.15966  ORF Transcript_10763/g.15966 Transcript_10763/m.15966 type:complete len:304 (+) Transcript_10763:136-1047(+)
MSSNSGETPLPLRMVISACAGMGAATICHPLDVIRVNMQVDSEGGSKPKYKGTIDAGKQIYAANGLRRGLYAGLSAAYLRQWLYGSCRIGLYSQALAHYKKNNNDTTPGLGMKMLMGSIAGGIGACVGNPSELALVRMGADNKKPPEQRRNYSNVLNCISRVAKEEGVGALWQGAGATVIRAMLMGSCLMGITSESKEVLMKTGYFGKDPSGVPLMFVSATISSFGANCITMPLDVVKSRLQNMKGKAYSGMLDCAQKSVAQEGVLVLWKGFTPAFIKLAPYTIISLTFLEKLNVMITGKAGL